MRLGIVGLPNSGKTTIFNALTRSNRPTGAVSGGKLEVFTAVVPVPDQRIDQLSALYRPKKTILCHDHLHRHRRTGARHRQGRHQRRAAQSIATSGRLHSRGARLRR
jgi:GTPase SAR1 family protein